MGLRWDVVLGAFESGDPCACGVWLLVDAILGDRRNRRVSQIVDEIRPAFLV